MPFEAAGNLGWINPVTGILRGTPGHSNTSIQPYAVNHKHGSCKIKKNGGAEMQSFESYPTPCSCNSIHQVPVTRLQASQAIGPPHIVASANSSFLQKVKHVADAVSTFGFAIVGPGSRGHTFA